MRTKQLKDMMSEGYQAAPPTWFANAVRFDRVASEIGEKRDTANQARINPERRARYADR